MIRLPLGLFLISLVLGQGQDKYLSYSTLARAKKEGRDFKVRAENQKSPITALAIHGGAIEPFTEKLAEAFAGTEFNLYTFEALGSPKSPVSELHVTATHFDDPRAVALVTEAALCVSFHGQIGDEDAVCVGGSNPKFSELMARGLSRSLPAIKVEFPCRRLPGVDPKNIGNRCKQGGVQLEFSVALLKALASDPKRSAAVVVALRSAVEASAGLSRPSVMGGNK